MKTIRVATQNAKNIKPLQRTFLCMGKILFFSILFNYGLFAQSVLTLIDDPLNNLQNDCDVIGLSNEFEGGIECSFGALAGNDLTVPAGSSAILESITLNLMVPYPEPIQEVYLEIVDPSSVNWYFFWDTFIPSSQTEIGTNNGYTIISVVLDIPDIFLPGSLNEPHPYWIFINTPAINGEMVLWEYSTTGIIGTYGTGLQVFFDPLIIDNSKEGVYTFEATCIDNDEISGAFFINCGDVVVGNTLSSTIDAAPFCDTSITAPGVWYQFSDNYGAPNTITLSTCSSNTNFDTKISVYTGGINNLTCVAGNDNGSGCMNNQSTVEFISNGNPLGNTTYYILVHGNGTDTGDFELTLSCDAIPPPNDEIANAINLNQVGFPFSDEDVALISATADFGTPAGCDIDGENGVWYKFTPTQNGQIGAQLGSPSGISTQVSFFEAPNENSSIDDLTYIEVITNHCSDSVSGWIPVIAGQTYYCFVVNSGGVSDVIFTNNILNTDDHRLDGFTYYPNPTLDKLNLVSVQPMEKVVLHTLLGQAVFELNPNSTETELNVSNLSVGTYILEVTIHNQKGIYRVIKN